MASHTSSCLGTFANKTEVHSYNLCHPELSQKRVHQEINSIYTSNILEDSTDNPSLERHSVPTSTSWPSNQPAAGLRLNSSVSSLPVTSLPDNLDPSYIFVNSRWLQSLLWENQQFGGAPVDLEPEGADFSPAPFEQPMAGDGESITQSMDQSTHGFTIFHLNWAQFSNGLSASIGTLFLVLLIAKCCYWKGRRQRTSRL